jgi:hypothetical protein
MKLQRTRVSRRSISKFLALGLLFSPAPLLGQDWAASDVNGIQHSVQEDLAEGKAVLVALGANWCGPCWRWHSSDVLQRLYRDFGPEGTDDLRVYFADGDPNSSVSLLLGNGGSAGNWIDGTPFPIFGPNGQGAVVDTAYASVSYPALYLHCPGTDEATEITETYLLPTAFDRLFPLLDFIRDMCPAPFANSALDATLIGAQDLTVCANEAYVPHALLYNAGSTTLQQATLRSYVEGALQQTFTWTGNLGAGDTAQVRFDTLFPTAPIGVELEVLLPNGQADGAAPGDRDALRIELPELTHANLLLRIRTDPYGNELYWRLLDANDTVVAEGGNLAVGTANIGVGSGTPPTHPQAYADNAVIDVPIELSSFGCHTLEMYDYWGDGLLTPGYYRITDEVTDSVVVQGNYFTDSVVERFEFGLNLQVTERSERIALTAYPNPSSGMVSISTGTPLEGTLELQNAQGKVLHRQRVRGGGPWAVDLSAYAPGPYLLQLHPNTGATGHTTLLVTR